MVGFVPCLLSNKYEQLRYTQRRSALVTGGATGLGLAISQRLAKEGYHVTIASSRNATIGNQVAKEINGLFIQTDVTQPEQVE